MAPPVNLLVRRNTSHHDPGLLGSTGDRMFVSGQNVSTTTRSPFDELNVRNPPDKGQRPINDIPPGFNGPSGGNNFRPPDRGSGPSNTDISGPTKPLGPDGRNDDQSTQGVTYILVGVAGVLIVVTLLAFLFMKRRRHLTRKLLTPVTQDKKTEFRNAIVTYKSEEECMGLDLPYDVSDHNLGKTNPNFHLHPRFGDVFYQTDPQGGLIPISAKGGLYHHENTNIHISVPDGINDSIIKQICVINGPPKKPPRDLDPQNILSDMITLLPHHSNLNKPILICFPIHTSRVEDYSKIQLIYSNTDPGDDPQWINLQQCKTPVKHPDSILWFISDGYCYLYASHFCHVFLAQHCTLVEQPALFLHASVHGEFIDKDNKLLIRVGFHCSKCNPRLLDQKTNWGALLGSGFRCIYGKEGVVQVNIQLDVSRWKGTSYMKEVDTVDLLNLCNLDDIYPPLTFIYRVDKARPAVNLQEDSLTVDVHISQGHKRTFTIEADENIQKLIKQPKCKSNVAVRLERTSGPEENADTSLEPVEHIDPCDPENNNTFMDENANVNAYSSNRRSYEEQQNDENANRESSGSFNQGWRRRERIQPCENDVTSVVVTEVISNQLKHELPDQRQLVPYERKGDSVFNEHISDEQVKLCTMLESNDKKKDTVVFMNEICDSQTNIDKINFNGQMVLQMWNIKVKLNQKTWQMFYHILHGLKMDKIAQQLKVTFDKDMLVHALEDLKLHLQMEPLLTQLLSKGIVRPADVQEMRSRADRKDGQWLEYLVYKALCNQPAASLYGFYDIVQKVHANSRSVIPLQM